MNKTFLLVANASYTEGSMLLVIDSLDKFVKLFKEYHKKKCDFMIQAVPEFYNKADRQSIKGVRWNNIVNVRNNKETEFITANNLKPFDFEFNTGCSYIKEGTGEGWFLNDITISSYGEKVESSWIVHKEFLSDLPEGTHYLGDYCA